MNRIRWAVGSVLLGLGAFSCSDSTFLPKPHGFPRIDLPEQTYKALPEQFGDYPYRFEVSEHAQVMDDTAGMHEPYWILINYPDWKAQVTVTYKPLLGDTMKFWYLNDDSRRLTDKHNIKAYAIDQTDQLKTKDSSTAVVFRLSGEVATQFQFFTTDSSQHFFRGALYFRTATKNDSLAPVIRFISEDMYHLLETFEWNPTFRLDASLQKEFK